MEPLYLHLALRRVETTLLSKIIPQSLVENPTHQTYAITMKTFPARSAPRTQNARRNETSYATRGTPNIAVSLQYMRLNIRDKSVNILVIISQAFMLLPLAFLDNK